MIDFKIVYIEKNRIWRFRYSYISLLKITHWHLIKYGLFIYNKMLRLNKSMRQIVLMDSISDSLLTISLMRNYRIIKMVI
jgi:hypothetical protein